MIRKEPLDGGLAVYRDTDRPGYTADSLLLVRFARVKRTDRVIDLGSGTGILALYGQSLYGGEWAGVEADPEQAALAARSAEENGQAIPFYAMDVREAPAFFGEGSFTAAVCNPPYFDPASPNPSEAFRAARHAGAEELGAFFAAAFRLPRPPAMQPPTPMAAIAAACFRKSRLFMCLSSEKSAKRNYITFGIALAHGV